MSEIMMIRTPAGLTPANQAQWEELAADRIKVGDTCKCVITKPRNYEFHKKFFGMLDACFDMQDSFDNREHWRAAVLIAAGHCETFINHLGEVNYKPKSISFARCDETQFQRIYQDTLQAICTHWLNGEAEQIDTSLEFT